MLSKRNGTPHRIITKPKPIPLGLVPIKLPVIDGYPVSKNIPKKIKIIPRVKYLIFIVSKP